MNLLNTKITGFCLLFLLIAMSIRAADDPGSAIAPPPKPAAPESKPEKIDPMKLTKEEFIAIVRRAPGQETWARMEGEAKHKREEHRMIKAPIRLAIRFTPRRIIAQLVFNGDEIYALGQTFDPPISTQEIQVKDKTKIQLGLYGLTPDDLTMGFLYRDVLREEPSERVKTSPCRVFVMKTPHEGEFARVYVSTEYFFPLKVEWFKGDPKDIKDAYRTLEIDSVRKEEDFWLVTGLKLYGPDWRTTVQFDKRAAGYAKDAVPGDLFVKNP